MATIIGRDTGQQDGKQPGVTDNPSGYIRPNEGYDPDGDGVLNPMRAAQVSQNHEVREAAGSGSFALDADAMRALVPRWEGIRGRLRELMNDATLLRGVTKPAEDEASIKQIRAVETHLETYETIIEQQFKYADQYLKALQMAISKYEESEHAAGDAAHKAGGAIDA